MTNNIDWDNPIKIPLTSHLIEYKDYIQQISEYMAKHYPNKKYMRDGKDISTAYVYLLKESTNPEGIPEQISIMGPRTEEAFPGEYKLTFVSKINGKVTTYYGLTKESALAQVKVLKKYEGLNAIAEPVKNNIILFPDSEK